MLPVKTSDVQLTAESLALHVASDGSAMTLSEAKTGRLLLRLSPAIVFRPVIDGVAVSVTLKSIHHESRSVTLAYQCESLEELTMTILVPEGEDALDFSCEFVPKAGVQLNRIEILPAGTQLNFFEAFNFRNRHHTDRTSPELPLGGKGCETDTYSTDWQFAPHPSALVLRAAEDSLFFGAMDLPTSFGLHFSAAGFVARHCHLDYGAAPHGQVLAAGERFTSPRVRFFFRRGRESHSLYREYGDMLARAGSVSTPDGKIREAWWREPLYCTWIDQCFKADIKVADALLEQSSSSAVASAVSVLDEALVEQAVAVIERERLPFRTILLDDGWQIARGQWDPHPGRFPDLRGLVDRLHAKGFKVAVWWNWAEIQPHANVDPAYLAGNGWLNRHRARVFDFSNPVTRDDYLRPLFHRLFSSDPGCYDLDGVKTDFLPDKVHPDMPLHDPAWRGEENYFVRVTRLFHQEMRRHKPDAIHIGASGHPWLAEWVDINRTYDVHSSNWREHEERARMLAATAPGCPVAYDMHQYIDFLPEWFSSARRLDASVEIGNVLWTRLDRFSSVKPADGCYWELLRQNLEAAHSVRNEEALWGS